MRACRRETSSGSTVFMVENLAAAPRAWRYTASTEPRARTTTRLAPPTRWETTEAPIRRAASRSPSTATAASSRASHWA